MPVRPLPPKRDLATRSLCHSNHRNAWERNKVSDLRRDHYVNLGLPRRGLLGRGLSLAGRALEPLFSLSRHSALLLRSSDRASAPLFRFDSQRHGTYSLRRELPIFRLWLVTHFGNLHKHFLMDA